MVDIPDDFGSGGSHLVPNASAEPSLRDVLRSMQSPTSTTGVAVAVNTATLTGRGLVVAVQATTADSTGPKAIIVDGTPAAGQVRVDYDADGIPTLTFAAADAVTEAAVVQT